MTSEYQYTTLAALEKYAKRDYSALDATQYSDANVEDTITNAEYFINTYVGTTFTGTIPDGIKLATKMIAKIYMDNDMIEKNIGEISDVNGGVIIDVLERYDIIQILEQYRSQYNADQGIFITKNQHTNRSAYWTRRPTGWQ